ncbi:hypothetical protein NTE_01876 [Candidatus Nitrososphaera evergladensis SR1]|uniref:Uncharacterized protein n=1 Tax=Candidatus Nitrososphaera evergladensis SR1 TaxID=1459636 RepID=A0A075MQW1_9ARCH|nr:hypothetical protein [Candidatus Nitrososphaera evergladensis]AIF83936.1 hypothetical protein NTE_01876 [Candidatus Nitrososphaera evergladensis SR1]
MVLDPPREQVNVKRMMIYSFIPFLSIYAGWRIQKFWLLTGINFGLGLVIGGLTGGIANSIDNYAASLAIIISGIAAEIAISLLLVKHYATEYNEKISAASGTESQSTTK